MDRHRSVSGAKQLSQPLMGDLCVVENGAAREGSRHRRHGNGSQVTNAFRAPSVAAREFSESRACKIGLVSRFNDRFCAKMLTLWATVPHYRVSCTSTTCLVNMSLRKNAHQDCNLQQHGNC